MSEIKKGSFPSGALFLAGFLTGVILPNLLWKLKWQQKMTASFYLLSRFSVEETEGWGCFLETLRMRGGLFLLCVMCGLTVFGVPLAVTGMLTAGVYTGALFSMCVLQFGLAGGAAGLSLLFPQGVVYLPVFACLAGFVYRNSMYLWKGNSSLQVKGGRYVTGCGVLFLLFLGGVWLEAFVNPRIVRLFFDILQKYF
ncbi:MAG: stage II sporulation protein M [Clostridiales bacterium]|nr:stage II sporulation protein M [Clostridiales bacterium]